MKKILLFILLLVAFGSAFSQAGNDTSKYTHYKFTYGNRLQRYWADSVLDIPHDTTHSKYGIAKISSKFYVGDGTRWWFVGGGGNDTVYVTQIGVGSPQIQTLYAVDGNLRASRAVPSPSGYILPGMNADSGHYFEIDTTSIAYKQWIIAQYGPPQNGSGINIYNSDGKVTGNRIANFSAHSMLFDSVFNPTFSFTSGITAPRFWLLDTPRDIGFSLGQSTSAGGGLKQGFQMDAYGIGAAGAPGGTVYYTQIMDSGRVEFIDQFNNYILMASTSYGQPGLTFNGAGGNYWMYNLIQKNDSTTYKPLAADGSGQIFRMDGWPGGGGGSTFTRQTYTSGTTVTVSGGNYKLNVNPAAAIAALTITLPASPTDMQTVEISFGGTITAGTVITALTVSPNSGQTILDNTPPAGASVTADDAILYQYISTGTYWKRIKY